VSFLWIWFYISSPPLYHHPIQGNPGHGKKMMYKKKKDGPSSTSRAIDDCHVSFLDSIFSVNLSFFFLSFLLGLFRFFPVQFELDVSPPPLLISHATLHLSSWNDVLLTYSRKKLSYFYSKKEIKGDK
jgi:hypothetical protein